MTLDEAINSGKKFFHKDFRPDAYCMANFNIIDVYYRSEIKISLLKEHVIRTPENQSNPNDWFIIETGINMFSEDNDGTP